MLSQKYARQIYRLSLLIILVFVPVILINFGADMLAESFTFSSEKKFRQRAEELFRNNSFFADDKNFWGQMFQDRLRKSPSAEAFIARINRLELLTSTNLRFLVLLADDTVVKNTLSDVDRIDDWIALKHIVYRSILPTGSLLNNVETSHMKRMLGPHFTQSMAKQSINKSSSSPINADFARIFPDYWFNIGADFFVVIEKPKDGEKSNVGLQYLAMQLRYLYRSVRFGIMREDSLYAASEPVPGEVLAEVRRSCHLLATFITTKNFLIQLRHLDASTQLFCYEKRHNWPASPGQLGALIALCYFFCLVLIFRSANGVYSLQMSVKAQVMLMLALANALPAYVLITVIADHFHQKETVMAKEKHIEQINYLHDIDEKISLENSRIFTDVMAACTALQKILKQGSMNNSLFAKLSKSFADSEFYFLASDSHVIGNNNGFYDGKKFYPSSTNQSFKEFLKTAEVMGKVGYLFLFLWNNVAADPKRVAETEIIIESLFQAPVTEAFQGFIRFFNSLSDYRWGEEDKPAFFTTFDSLADSIADYMLIAFFDRGKITNRYAFRNVFNVARNHLGSQIYFGRISDTERRQAFGLPWKLYPLLFKTETHPGSNADIVRVDGEDYVYSGLTCFHLKNTRLIALYPVKRLKEVIQREMLAYIYAVLVAVILIFSIAALFLHGFITPIRQLNEGALAMQNLLFTHRLPDLGSDELGEMATIFNQNMEDLEELTKAAQMQNCIMPLQAIKHEKFSFDGKSLILAGLGGDYFDYFATEGHNYAIMLGDVAGHGVGASLLMIMAKTAVSFYRGFYSQPLHMIEKLHELILSVKTKKQKKIMTFQYLYLDAQSFRATYSNAGACSPILVKHSDNSCRELELAGPALGAFKKSSFSEIEMSFEQEDALIFYTDGIVEAKNGAGAVLGYEGLKEILKASWDADATRYYQKIVEAYHLWLSGSPAEDDLTLVILVMKW